MIPARYRTTSRGLLLLCLLVGLGGCFNEGKQVIDLGSVSLGQQLLDLKAARDAGAISDAEYAKAKDSFLELADAAGDVLGD